MINTIKVSSLRNNELLQFFNDVENRCAQQDLQKLKLTDNVSVFSTEIKKLEDSFNRETGSEVTEQLIEIDANRDSDLMGIKTVCEGYAYMRDKKLSGAANKVLDSITRHGKNLTRLNYHAETLVIDAILKDWAEDTELKNALEMLNLTGWAKMLQKENQEFSETYQERIDDKMKSVGLSFTELRAHAINAYRALSDTIFAYSIINKNPEYNKLCEAINLIIADYNLIIDKRESKQATE